jgi:hypothetical protein
VKDRRVRRLLEKYRDEQRQSAEERSLRVEARAREFQAEPEQAQVA